MAFVPTQPSSIKGETNTGPVSPASPVWARELRYAGFWIRGAAFILDTGFIQVALFIVFAATGMARGSLTDNPMSYGEALFLLGIDVVLIALIVLYYAGFSASAWQATPGKKILGLHIMRADGRRIGLGLGIGRYFAYIPSSLLLGIGFLMIGWNKEKTGLHDMLCGTRVVHGKPRPRNLATVFE